MDRGWNPPVSGQPIPDILVSKNPAFVRYASSPVYASLALAVGKQLDFCICTAGSALLGEFSNLKHPSKLT